MKKVLTVSKETGIPRDTIYRYIRSGKLTEGIDYGYDLENVLRVNPESIIKYRKNCKPTGRPCKPKSDFKLDWDLFTKNVLAKYGTMAEFFDKCKMKHHRFYFIKNGETNPTKAEQKILRKEI